uniref:Cytochrome c oxidase subunit 3 n=2 Tax=Bemisia tabaci TaxID=7038 RepID=A0A678NAB8_BEMTA|nr:cytochrome c oxidase subunit III [Bemisia tabaci]WEX31291.1 cytochrome c oxidase subunit III [Bemisia tabaci]
MMMDNHFFHLVKHSPWPLLIALNLINSITSITKLILNSSSLMCFFFVFISVLIMIQWWRDVIRESLYEGSRSLKINYMIGSGMIFFIVSEICLFSSFFWMYFYYGLSPDMETGSVWPPFKITQMSFMDIPLLNTMILLMSGFFITWAHYNLTMNSFKNSMINLMMSILLGLYFLVIQGYEYMNSSISFNDSVFGNSFFILTGFHGLHVMIGLIFLVVMMLQLIKKKFSFMNMNGFEYSIWYWHFVDIVWLFLYLTVYWWGM